MNYYKNRRKYIRVPFQKNIKYRICYKNQVSKELIDASTADISSGGILFKTKWPPPSLAIIEIEIDLKKFKEHLSRIDNKAVNIDLLYTKNNKIYGEVKRIKEYPESGFYEIAVHLVHKNEK